MALIDSEGFGLSTAAADFNTFNVFVYSGVGSGGNPTVNTAGGAFGDPYMSHWNSNLTPQRTLPVGCTSFFFGARTRLNNGDSPSDAGYVFNDASFVNQFRLRFTSDGVIAAYRGAVSGAGGYYNGGTLLGASAVLSMPTNGWQYVEVGGVIDAAAGSVVVRVNGVTMLNLTGVNTKGSASSGVVQRIGFQGHGVGPANTFDTQHWYVCDATGAAPWNTFLGDVRVQTLRPTANDAVQFTPIGLATNWQNAASYPPVPGTNYNASSTPGNQDTFVMQQIDSNDVVFGVHVKPLIYKSDAGARTAASVLKSAATVAVGATTVLSETSAQVKTMYQADPATSAQWTAAAVNAMKAGARLVA